MKRLYTNLFLRSSLSLFAISASYAAEYTWSGAASGDAWDTSNNHWAGAAGTTWDAINGILNLATFNTAGLSSSVTGTVYTNGIKFEQGAALTGGMINLGGVTPSITTNADASIGSVLAGTAGLKKGGTNKLTLTGVNTYTGATSINAGTLTYSGSGGNANTNALLVGGATGRGVLNFNSNGNFAFGTTGGDVRVGGNSGVSDSGIGAINQTSGNVTLARSGTYLEIGVGGASNTAYGSYSLSGGNLTITSLGGIRVGNGGIGSFVQTGGVLNIGRWFAIGAGNASGNGTVTFSGGTAAVNTSYRILVGDTAGARATFNLGTQTGGNAVVTSLNGSGITMLGNVDTASATMNLNSGTLVLGGAIQRNGTTGSIATLNLNGGTLRPGVNATNLIASTNGLSANVYNGGLTVDTQSNSASISANLLTTTGNGIYPAGGVINQGSTTGSGYIGKPLVTVSTNAAGTGATAIANVANGEITGVTLTCPGQNYAVGDVVTFTFAGGGATSPASPFVYTLTAPDLAANGSGGLTKLGSGTLTLSGTNTFAGPVTVTGKLFSSNLTLNNTTLTINGFSPEWSSPAVQATAGFTTGGTVLVQINGTFGAGVWPIIYYPIGESIGGSGIGALQLQTASLPRGTVAQLEDNPSGGSVDLNISAYNPLTWKGNANSIWDLNTTTNWVIGAVAEKYLNDDTALFNDNATGSTDVILNTTVAPKSVTFDNDTKNYTLSGSGAISGATTLTKSNDGTLTILNANTFSGATTVNGGSLSLGDGVTNGSVTGPLIAADGAVVFNPAGVSTASPQSLGGATGVFRKVGTGKQVLTNSTNSSTADFQITEGTLQYGNGTVNGVAGSMNYVIAAGGTLRFENATVVTPPWVGISGSGSVVLNTAQAINGTADWGSLGLTANYTGTLTVERGRVGANAGSSALGSCAKIRIFSGAQFLAFTSGAAYTTPIEIAGEGWGENGYPGGLRLAGNATATWEGPVTLTANSGISAQRGANFTVNGSISGDYRCEFYAGDPIGDSGVVRVAPAAAVQNSYTSTRINGRPNGSIIAGNAYAFSTGPLTVDGAILKLDGYDFSFAHLSGAGGAIGNYNASTPATIAVGADDTNSSYAGILRNGAGAALSLLKTGMGKLTLTGANSYTGNTVIDAGTLELADNAQLRFAIGATSGVCNTLSGAGNASLAGDFVIDTTAAAALTSGTWQLENVPSLSGAYEPTFSVINPDGSAWTDAGSDKWTMKVGANTWTFDENTGTLIVAAGDNYDTWTEQITNAADRDRSDDPDGDGFTNIQEYLFGGDPNASTAALTTFTRNGSTLTIRWRQRTDGGTYQLKKSKTLTEPWILSGAVVSNDGAASGSYQPKKAEILIDSDKDFFRVEGSEASGS